MSDKTCSVCFVAVSVFILCAVAVNSAIAQPATDGMLDKHYGHPRSIQYCQTGFGDNDLGQPGFANGSELDAAYVVLAGPELHLFLAGNLESNFNKLEIFIDSVPGGQNRLRGDNANVDFDGLNRMGDDGNNNGLTFDAGFTADYWISLTGGPTPDYTLFANYATLPTNGNGVGRFLGSTPAASDGTLNGGDNPDQIRAAINNRNTGGVAGGGIDPDIGGSAMTGMELVIPLPAIGFPSGPIKVCVFINGSNHDFVSNQVLGTLGRNGEFNPGEPRMLDFNNFAGDQFVQIAFPDFDSDGVADSGDNCPTTYNPAQQPQACNNNITIKQVDFLSTGGEILAQDSDYGLLTIDLPNPDGILLYMNAEIGGNWVIQNLPITGNDYAFAAPIQRYHQFFEIGPRGVNVAGQPRLMRVSIAPFKLANPPPPNAQPFTRVIGEHHSANGNTETREDAAPPPAAGAGAFGMPMAPAVVVEEASRPGFNTADLDEPAERNSCAANAIASSMVWLNRTYGLGVSEDANTTTTKNNVLDELERLLRIDPAIGAFYTDIIPAKKAYITRNKLPLTIEGQGVGSPNTGTAIDPAEIFKQMKMGQDVEVCYRWGGAANDDHGHTVAIRSMKKEGDMYTAEFTDDDDQSNAGGQNRNRSHKLIMVSGEWTWNGRRIVGWRSESPTLAALLRAIAAKSAALASGYGGLGGMATFVEASDLLDKAMELKWLVEKLVAMIENRVPPATNDQKALAAGMLAKACEAVAAAREVLRTLGMPTEQARAIAKAQAAAEAVQDGGSDLTGTYPADADFDDVPDSSDNAPNDANPDQTDCNTDGTGDVVQLGGNADRNRNGVLDICERLGDMNNDGMVDGDDIDLFVQAITDPAQFAMDHPGLDARRADINGDGRMDMADVDPFVLMIVDGF